ncbi:hypothetical protein HYW44_04495 [Candidatus Daviesbacteria bacterium]|nr:hypothetical protein [Candidatus Daviesbacteria bacterium]
MGKENSQNGFRSNIELGTRYLAGGALALAAVISLGAGNLVLAAAEAFTGYLVWPKSPKPA